MNRQHQSPRSESTFVLPIIPLQVISMDGQIIDTSTDRWRIRKSADGAGFQSIVWKSLESILGHPILSERASRLIRLYIADRLTRKKPPTVMNDFGAFCGFFKWLATTMDLPSFDWTDLNEGIGRAFLDYAVKHTANKGNDFSRLRTFYEWGVARQYPDFDRKQLRILQSMIAPGNSKGHHVRFRHETKGPLSPDEMLLVTKAITAGEGVASDRVIVMLHLELGINPNASVRLKNRDFKRFQVGDKVEYQLDIPRVKKRTACRETKRRPISPRLGILIEELQAGEADSPLLHWLSNSSPESTMRAAMNRFVEMADLISPRTLKRLILSPRRFRFTLATQMAEEGASKFHIAEVLDHTDLQNVQVYVETASTIADYAEKATDHALKPLVNRFLGKITDSCERQAFDDIPNRLIPAEVPHLPLPVLNAGGIGLCGRDMRKDGLCQMFPPLSCYLCPSFMALRSGPHRELLDSIETFICEWENRVDKRILLQLDDIRIAINQVLDHLASSKSSSGLNRDLSTTGGVES